MADDAKTPSIDDPNQVNKDDASTDHETDKEEFTPAKEEDKSVKCVAIKSFGHFTEKNPRYRRVMEDEHVVFDQFAGDSSSVFLAVYDGHGGRATVEFVSKNLHNILEQTLKAAPNPAEALKQAYKKTDEDIAAAKIQFSGCTAVTCLIKNSSDGKRKLYCGNVGDARAVVVRNGTSVRLTYDHKASDESETKRIVAAGGFVLANRVNGMLAVTRSLGDITMKEYVISEPYMQELDLTPTDTHLIVACDGLWDVISDQDAYELIKNQPSAQKAAETLLITALQNGSTDNISVIVAML